MLNALEALKLARTEGVKVRPKNWSHRYIQCNGGMWFSEEHLTRGRTQATKLFTASNLINPDGSPVIWEIVP
jgi:hypothetical protein